MIRVLGVLAIAAFAALPATAQQCRLALALALDVSSSVDEVEYDLQRVGLASALNAAEVRHAILSGAQGYVTLAVYEWSGFNQHKLHMDWMRLTSEDDIDEAVRLLAKMERSHDDFPTAVGQALGYGATLLSRAPDCTRKVLDVSGDGINNYGYGAASAYANFPFENVTVNGLAILTQNVDVLNYYQNQILHGRNAFVIPANSFEDFESAMTRKLYREVNDIIFGQLERPAPIALRRNNG
ncbi:MAG: DUF1194 domain-containing protein [Roseovarius sp.]